MVYSFVPDSEPFSAETTTAVDVCGHRLPVVHAREHLAVVHQAKVLPQMILPIKCTGVQTFFFTLAVVVAFNVLVTGILLLAVDTFLLACCYVCNDWARRAVST